jgi:hypothetical protein
MEGVKQALADNAGAKSGDVAVVEGYRDVSVMLGSNLTTPYIFVVLDLESEGPIVVEYPAGATASSVIDWWDRPIVDLGVPGSENGNGTTVVVVGPGQDDPTDVPAGSRVLKSQTFNVVLFGRVLESDQQRGQDGLGGAENEMVGSKLNFVEMTSTNAGPIFFPIATKPSIMNLNDSSSTCHLRAHSSSLAVSLRRI